MKRVCLLIALLSLLYGGCGDDLPRHYTYRPPANVDDGFQVGSLAEVSIDSVLIEQAVDSIGAGRYREVHALLIVRDDKLVLETYFEGHRFEYERANHHGEWVRWDRTMPHRVMSVTKSITSACIGIAVDKGFIRSVHQSIFDYLPDYQHLKEEGKEKITIEHLLTMTSGLEWNEWELPYANRNNDVIMTYYVDDPVAYYLNKPLVDEPGTSFTYAGGCNILLGAILETATGMNIDEFSGEYLFGPLGIAPYHWARYRDGTVDAAGSIEITPRDMAKIGVTFLNEGLWNGQRILSEQWVEKSAASYPGNSWLNDWDDHFGLRGYSYSWWTHQFSRGEKRMEMFYAAGWGGQFIMVLPELRAVVVFTCGNYLSYRPPFEILKKYVLPAFD
jgi:CubicO group peptidase (beta-lactamase class C family)